MVEPMGVMAEGKRQKKEKEAEEGWEESIQRMNSLIGKSKSTIERRKSTIEIIERVRWIMGSEGELNADEAKNLERAAVIAKEAHDDAEREAA